LLGPYHQGKFWTPAAPCPNPPGGSNSNGPPWGNVHYYLLPFIEQDNFYKATYDPNCDGNNSQPGYRPWINRWTPMKTYICPSDPSIPATGTGPVVYCAGWADTPSLCTYSSNAQVFGTTDAVGNIATYDGAARIPSTFQDGTSNTIVFAERYGNCGYYGNDTTNYPAGSGGQAWNWWGWDSTQPTFAAFSIGPASKFQQQPAPYKTNCDVYRASAPHSGGMQVCLGDASVRNISSGISAATWWAACTPAGGETLGNDW
jgi:hypothetical protein